MERKERFKEIYKQELRDQIDQKNRLKQIEKERAVKEEQDFEAKMKKDLEDIAR